MNRWGPVVVGIVALGLGSGCNSYINVTFKPENLPAPAIDSPRVEGKALLVMSAEDLAWVYQGSPPGRFDYYIKGKFEVGEITRQAAHGVLAANFVSFDEATAVSAGYTVVMVPKVDKFAYDWARVARATDIVGSILTLGGHTPDIKPWVEMDMRVAFHGADGRLLFSETYRSGRVFGDRSARFDEEVHPLGKKRGLKLSRHFHATIATLLERAVADYRQRAPH